MKNNSIRLFRDGKRLIIVIEDGGEIAPVITRMVGATIEGINGLAPAAEQKAELPDIKKAEEMPVQTPETKPVTKAPVKDLEPEKRPDSVDMPKKVVTLPTDPVARLKAYDAGEMHDALVRALMPFGHTTLRTFLLEGNQDNIRSVLHAIES